MIQSRSQSPETGTSAGIVSTSSIELAATSGAKTGLKKSPVKFVRKKREMMAKGANLAERKWGIRGNFISGSPCERWPGPSINTSNLQLRMVTLTYKEREELAIEDRN